LPKRTLAAKLKGWNALQFERVGLNLRPELVAVKDVNGDAAAFAKPWPSNRRNLGIQPDPDERKCGCDESRREKPAGFKRPLIYAATADNVDAWAHWPRRATCRWPSRLTPWRPWLPLTDKLTGMGLKDLVWTRAAASPSRPMEIKWPSAARL
jgi:acetyl-CoA decarbonylase/synthase complex subunit gamma